MKVLTIFIDMLRPDFLKIHNPSVSLDTPFDIFFKDLGGVFSKNAFTNSPDTCRSMATFYTGKFPWDNGCDLRYKWPEFFLDPNENTLFKILEKQGLEISCFTNPIERLAGFFPPSFAMSSCHNSSLDLDEYLKKLRLQDDHFVFLGIPDLHWALDDYGYSYNKLEDVFQSAMPSLEMIFKYFEPDDFDHIFIFSDHGFKYSHEHSQPSYRLLDANRSQIFFMHRVKGQTALDSNSELISIQDIHHTIVETVQSKALTVKTHPYIISEDANKFYEFSPISLWSVIGKESIYLRDVKSAYTLFRDSGEIHYGVSCEKDAILKKENPSFFKVFDDYSRAHFNRYDDTQVRLISDSYTSRFTRKQNDSIRFRLYKQVFLRLGLSFDYQDIIFLENMGNVILHSEEPAVLRIQIMQLFSDWLETLRQANEKHPVFDSNAFNKYLATILYQNCLRQSYYIGMPAYDFFWKSPLSQSLQLNLKSRLKFKLCCCFKIKP